MTMYEALTGNDPFRPDLDGDEVLPIILDGGRPPLDGMVAAFHDILKEAWAQLPRARPEIDELVVNLRRIRRKDIRTLAQFMAMS